MRLRPSRPLPRRPLRRPPPQWSTRLRELSYQRVSSSNPRTMSSGRVRKPRSRPQARLPLRRLRRRSRRRSRRPLRLLRLLRCGLRSRRRRRLLPSRPLHRVRPWWLRRLCRRVRSLLRRRRWLLAQSHRLPRQTARRLPLRPPASCPRVRQPLRLPLPCARQPRSARRLRRLLPLRPSARQSYPPRWPSVRRPRWFRRPPPRHHVPSRRLRCRPPRLVLRAPARFRWRLRPLRRYPLLPSPSRVISRSST